jgi:hypothetical protein
MTKSNRPWDVLQAWIGLEPEHLVEPGVDRIDRSREAEVDEVLDEPVSSISLVRRRAHDGDALGAEEGLELLVGYGSRGIRFAGRSRHGGVFGFLQERRSPLFRM